MSDRTSTEAPRSPTATHWWSKAAWRLDGQRAIRIEHGVFVARRHRVAEIRGRFEGELTGESNWSFATGRVSGRFRYGKVAMREGGRDLRRHRGASGTQGSGVARAAARAMRGPAVPRRPRGVQPCRASRHGGANGHAPKPGKRRRAPSGQQRSEQTGGSAQAGAQPSKHTGRGVALSFAGALRCRSEILSCRG